MALLVIIITIFHTKKSSSVLVLTEIGKRTATEMKIEFITRGTITGFWHWFMALQIGFHTIINGIGKPKTSIQWTIRPSNSTTTVETSGLVKHHFLSLTFPNVLLSRARLSSQLFGWMASLLQSIGMDLQYVSWPRHDADTFKALVILWGWSCVGGLGRRWAFGFFRGQNNVSSQSSMAGAPWWNGIKKYGYGIVGNFSGDHGLA